MTKTVIRLNKTALLHAAIDNNLKKNTEIAEKIGVSATQLYRAQLPVDHPNYASPGTGFISGVLNAFDGPFERFFFLDDVLRGRNNNSDEGGEQDAIV
ncbi:hypothetical protein SAMN05421503_2453 [Terribacillus aidingensis]|uniref:Uncharacterized protein n=1 Tax=Terribacillus aidingensis TaxID=586416 RepID=A0A285P3T6_9BACI|nr:hypothetical protein [Terribacillus aidingensis]SNZ14531.1 hypothetical protein SAMN05421503_2453 [Terribacillus aidingensis]